MAEAVFHVAEQVDSGKGVLDVFTLLGAEREVLDLFDGTDAQQGIAALERVVEEGERPVALQGDEPEGELGHLHGHRVDVHAIEAAVGHVAPGNGETLGGVGGDEPFPGVACGEVAFGCGENFARIGSLGDFPCLHKPLGQIAAGLHEERARTHRHVADFKCQDFAGRFEPFRCGWFAFGNTIVNKRFERVLDDGFGKASRRVVRAGAAAVSCPE